MDQTDQITRQTGLVPDVQAIEVVLCRNGFSEACWICPANTATTDETLKKMATLLS